MEFVWNLGFIGLGLVALVWGAQWLVQGASRLASSFGVSPLIIGLTVVSVGTSLPELLVSVTAAIQGINGVSLGNVIGSNIANIGLILGLTAVITPLQVHHSMIRREIPIMIGVSVGIFVLALNGHLGQLEGLGLLVLLVVYNWVLYNFSEDDTKLEAEYLEYDIEEELLDTNPRHRLRHLGFIGVGVVCLMVGAFLLVEGATFIAREAGVSETVIGLTIVAFGTSLPELATSVVAAMRGEADIAIGNVVGSNIVNILLILGATIVIKPMPIERSLLASEFPIMLAFAVVLFVFVIDKKLARHEGGLFMVGYGVFTALLFIN